MPYLDSNQRHFVFGPVRSKRLGYSLGIDLLGSKICSFNCVYCEVEKTKILTTQRKPYVPSQKVIQELDSFFADHPHISLDYITFSGKGEPTLNSEISTVIQHIKTHYPYKISVLTNASLLNQKNVRHDIQSADLIMPSLDAVSPQTFKKINLPQKSVNIASIIHGIKQLRLESQAQIWLEILFVQGINHSSQEIEVLKKVVQFIRPHKVCINTIYRPPAFKKFKPISQHQVQSLEKNFNQLVNKNYSVKKHKTSKSLSESWNKDDIIDELKRILAIRPSTFDDLQTIFCSEGGNLNPHDFHSIIQDLLKQKILVVQFFDHLKFYALQKK